MDAREREVSQSRSLSIKRPWEENSTVPEKATWNGVRLPPVDSMPYARPLSGQAQDVDNQDSHSRYHLDARISTPKKARFDEDNYNAKMRIAYQPGKFRMALAKS